MNQFIITGHI